MCCLQRGSRIESAKILLFFPRSRHQKVTYALVYGFGINVRQNSSLQEIQNCFKQFHYDPIRSTSPDSYRHSFHKFNTTYTPTTKSHNFLSARCGAVTKSTNGHRKPVHSFDKRRRPTRCSTTSVQ